MMTPNNNLATSHTTLSLSRRSGPDLECAAWPGRGVDTSKRITLNWTGNMINQLGGPGEMQSWQLCQHDICRYTWWDCSLDTILLRTSLLLSHVTSTRNMMLLLVFAGMCHLLTELCSWGRADWERREVEMTRDWREERGERGHHSWSHLTLLPVQIQFPIPLCMKYDLHSMLFHCNNIIQRVFLKDGNKFKTMENLQKD